MSAAQPMFGIRTLSVQPTLRGLTVCDPTDRNSRGMPHLFPWSHVTRHGDVWVPRDADGQRTRLDGRIFQLRCQGAYPNDVAMRAQERWAKQALDRGDLSFVHHCGEPQYMALLSAAGSVVYASSALYVLAWLFHVTTEEAWLYMGEKYRVATFAVGSCAAAGIFVGAVWMARMAQRYQRWGEVTRCAFGPRSLSVSYRKGNTSEFAWDKLVRMNPFAGWTELLFVGDNAVGLPPLSSRERAVLKALQARFRSATSRRCRPVARVVLWAIISGLAGAVLVVVNHPERELRLSGWATFGAILFVSAFGAFGGFITSDLPPRIGRLAHLRVRKKRPRPAPPFLVPVAK